jgi:hypothetical protein
MKKINFLILFVWFLFLGNVFCTETPTIQIVTLTSGDTEYSVVLPENTKIIDIQARTAVSIRMAWETGQVASGTDYWTIKANNTHYQNNLYASGKTLYLASSTAGTVVEIKSWR